MCACPIWSIKIVCCRCTVRCYACCAVIDRDECPIVALKEHRVLRNWNSTRSACIHPNRIEYSHFLCVVVEWLIWDWHWFDSKFTALLPRMPLDRFTDCICLTRMIRIWMHQLAFIRARSIHDNDALIDLLLLIYRTKKPEIHPFSGALIQFRCLVPLASSRKQTFVIRIWSTSSDLLALCSPLSHSDRFRLFRFRSIQAFNWGTLKCARNSI